jgi:hypothetical protein
MRVKCIQSVFVSFLASLRSASIAAMPGEDPSTPGGPRSPKKRTPIDLSVSPSKTKRGSPPKKKLRQQSILLSIRTKTRHDELAQAAEELGLPAPAPFKSASGAPIQLAPAIVEQQQRETQREAAAGAEAAGEGAPPEAPRPGGSPAPDGLARGATGLANPTAWWSTSSRSLRAGWQAGKGY